MKTRWSHRRCTPLVLLILALTATAFAAPLQLVSVRDLWTKVIGLGGLPAGLGVVALLSYRMLLMLNS